MISDSCVVMVDPPSGWKYGFPCKWDKKKYPTYEELLRAHNYPEKDIKFALNHSRYWKAKNEDH